MSSSLSFFLWGKGSVMLVAGWSFCVDFVSGYPLDQISMVSSFGRLGSWRESMIFFGVYPYKGFPSSIFLKAGIWLVRSAKAGLGKFAIKASRFPTICKSSCISRISFTVGEY